MILAKFALNWSYSLTKATLQGEDNSVYTSENQSSLPQGRSGGLTNAKLPAVTRGLTLKYFVSNIIVDKGTYIRVLFVQL